jgi:hypothetical protein
MEKHLGGNAVRLFLAPVVLCGCGILAACIQTTNKSPAAIELECPNSVCPQSLADEAEEHCQQYGLHAQMQRVRTGMFGLHRWEKFDCVNPAAPDTAGR